MFLKFKHNKTLEFDDFIRSELVVRPLGVNRWDYKEIWRILSIFHKFQNKLLQVNRSIYAANHFRRKISILHNFTKKSKQVIDQFL